MTERQGVGRGRSGGRRLAVRQILAPVIGFSAQQRRRRDVRERRLVVSGLHDSNTDAERRHLQRLLRRTRQVRQLVVVVHGGSGGGRSRRRRIVVVRVVVVRVVLMVVVVRMRRRRRQARSQLVQLSGRRKMCVVATVEILHLTVGAERSRRRRRVMRMTAGRRAQRQRDMAARIVSGRRSRRSRRCCSRRRRRVQRTELRRQVDRNRHGHLYAHNNKFIN